MPDRDRKTRLVAFHSAIVDGHRDNAARPLVGLCKKREVADNTASSFSLPLPHRGPRRILNGPVVSPSAMVTVAGTCVSGKELARLTFVPLGNAGESRCTAPALKRAGSNAIRIGGANS